ncbi:MAG: hypothetical protein EOP45_19230, partial [Sphingobacteriaceae bacterium]
MSKCHYIIFRFPIFSDSLFKSHTPRSLPDGKVQHSPTGMQAFADKLVQEVSMDLDYVWIHDYHLLVLPS